MHRFSKSLENVETIAFTLLRLGVGVIFVVHGAMKLADISATVQSLSSHGIPLPTVSAYLAIAGELGGGLGVLFGLLTRVAACGTACVMLVAIAFVHLGHGLLAKNGGWEYPLVLLLTSLLFIAHGPGRFSVDALIKKARGESSAQRPLHAGVH